MTAKKRLIKYLKYKDVSQYDFSRRTGLSNGYLNSGENVTSANLDAITNIFRDLNLIWVIKGIGPMIIPEETNQSSYPNGTQESSDNILNEDYASWTTEDSDKKLLNMTSEQLVHLNRAFKIAIKSKDQTIQAKDDVIVTLKEVIAEKENSNRLKDEMILELRQKQSKG